VVDESFGSRKSRIEFSMETKKIFRSKKLKKIRAIFKLINFRVSLTTVIIGMMMMMMMVMMIIIIITIMVAIIITVLIIMHYAGFGVSKFGQSSIM
jgi:fatty acid desaturase